MDATNMLWRFYIVTSLAILFVNKPIIAQNTTSTIIPISTTEDMDNNNKISNFVLIVVFVVFLIIVFLIFTAYAHKKWIKEQIELNALRQDMQIKKWTNHSITNSKNHSNSSIAIALPITQKNNDHTKQENDQKNNDNNDTVTNVKINIQSADTILPSNMDKRKSPTGDSWMEEFEVFRKGAMLTPNPSDPVNRSYSQISRMSGIPEQSTSYQL